MSLLQELNDSKERLIEEFGTAEDDELDENPKLALLLDVCEEMDFYDYMALMRTDPTQGITRTRTWVKMMLLPIIQLVLPLVLIQHEYELIDWEKESICPARKDLVYRGCGFIMMIYSVWQINESLDKPTSMFLTKFLIKRWSITGSSPDLWFACGFWVQWIGSIAIQVALYSLLRSTDRVLDMVKDCLALNFLLSVDNEWVDARHKEKGKKAAVRLFKALRDTPISAERVMRHRQLRGSALQVYEWAVLRASTFALLTGYALAALFFSCRLCSSIP